MLEVIEKLAIIFASLSAGIVAIRGFKIWQAQLKGTAEFDLARRVLKAALIVRDEIWNVRNPFQTAGEIQAALKEENADPDLAGISSSPYVYSVRWKKLVSALTSLESEIFEAEVLWGKTPRSLFNDLNMHITTLSLAISEDLQESRQNYHNYSEHRESKRQARSRILYGHREQKDNPFTEQLSTSIIAFEKFLAPKLNRS